MLNILKNAIRKKKLYFTVEYSLKNIDKLNDLLINNVILGFSKTTLKKRTVLFVYINYCHNFNSSVTYFSLNLKKHSKQQNNILDKKYMDSNFVLNINPEKKDSNLVYKNTKPKYYIKFR